MERQVEWKMEMSLTPLAHGGAGNDLLIGSSSNYLFGGGGSDLIIGGAGLDIVEGDGEDSGGNEHITGLPWAYQPTHIALEFDDVKQQWTLYTEFDENGVTAKYGRLSTLSGDGGADTIITGAGQDWVFGETGDDYLSLGSGDDHGVGGAGADIVDGGDDNDHLFGDFNWDAGAAPDGETEEQRTIRVGLEGQYHGNDLLNGGAGNDYIEGNGRDDVLYGGSGDDTLPGDDRITPGAWHGNDLMDGGDGNDQMWGGGGSDELYGGKGDDLLIGDAAGVPIEFQCDDYLGGEEGDDLLRGYGGNDILVGGSGQDQLQGEAGDDALEGNEGDDLLWAGEGNDQLNGGTGTDYLNGGAGDDTYVFQRVGRNNRRALRQIGQPTPLYSPDAENQIIAESRIRCRVQCASLIAPYALLMFLGIGFAASGVAHADVMGLPPLPPPKCIQEKTDRLQRMWERMSEKDIAQYTRLAEAGDVSAISGSMSFRVERAVALWF